MTGAAMVRPARRSDFRKAPLISLLLLCVFQLASVKICETLRSRFWKGQAGAKETERSWKHEETMNSIISSRGRLPFAMLRKEASL